MRVSSRSTTEDPYLSQGRVESGRVSRVALTAFFLLLAVTSGSLIASGFGVVLPLVMTLALLVIVAFRHPNVAWGLYFLSISATGFVFEVGPAKVRAEMLALPLLIICLVNLRAKSRSRNLASGLSSLGYLLAAAYFLWAAITTLLNAPTPAPSLWILLQIMTGFTAFLWLRIDDDQKMRMVQIGSLVLGAVAALSVLSWLGRSFAGLPPSLSIGVAADGRLIGFSFETNIFASQCVGWLAVASRWWGSLPRTVRFLNLVLGVAVILAGTRAAWIALAVLIAVVGLESSSRSLKWIWGLAAGVVGLLVLLPSLSQTIEDKNSLAWRLGNLLSTDEGTGAYRAGIYETALSDIDTIGRAIAGSGMNSFSQFHLLDPTGVSASYLSSIWIAVYYDTGIIGFILFFGLLVSIVISRKNLRDGVIVLTVLLICASATNLVWFQYPWIYLGLLSTRVVALRGLKHYSRIGQSTSAVHVRLQVASGEV